MNELYTMKLHEVISLIPTSKNCSYSSWTVMRVPGGWIYQVWDTDKQDLARETFVPFNNEFQESTDKQP